MLFIILRSDGHRFAPAADIDPAYAAALQQAAAAGVLCLGLSVAVSPTGLVPAATLPIITGASS